MSRAFEATTDDMLTLTTGAVVDIVSDLSPDWWYVKSALDGKEGYFPSTCLIKQIVDPTIENTLPRGWQKHLNSDNRECIYQSYDAFAIV